MGGSVGEKLEKLASKVKTASGQVTDAATKVAQHPNTKAAANRAKEMATEAANQVVDQARQVSKSQIAKDAAVGAGIGAVLAVPVPLVGPLFGAVVGGGIGALFGLKRAWGSAPQASSEATAPFDFHKAMTELDDLRQKGILSQEEFDARKKKLLRKG
jgi:hypothetical protein